MAPGDNPGDSKIFILVLHHRVLLIADTIFFPFNMPSADGRADSSHEHVLRLQMELATQRAHIQLLTERLHAADLRAQVEATKAAADSALHELRLQHTREAELLQRVVEGMQAQLRDKDHIVALLTRQLADKEQTVSDMQAEVRALRAEKDATVAAANEKQAQVAATAPVVAERRRDRTVDDETRHDAPVAGSVVSADNFHAGARVKWQYLGRDKNAGIVLSLGPGSVTVRWDNGTLVRLGLPNTLTYA
jgi:hypothetical protein